MHAVEAGTPPPLPLAALLQAGSEGAEERAAEPTPPLALSTLAFPVEVADGRRLTISWQSGADAAAVARAFAAEHALPEEDKADIVAFVHKAEALVAQQRGGREAQRRADEAAGAEAAGAPTAEAGAEPEPSSSDALMQAALEAAQAAQAALNVAHAEACAKAKAVQALNERAVAAQAAQADADAKLQAANAASAAQAAAEAAAEPRARPSPSAMPSLVSAASSADLASGDAARADSAEAPPAARAAVATLRSMGFAQDEALLATVAANNADDIEGCVHDLAALSEWDTLLTDLSAMGFDDASRNRAALLKSRGDVRAAVRELVKGAGASDAPAGSASSA